jgi:hypothetical protein
MASKAKKLSTYLAILVTAPLGLAAVFTGRASRPHQRNSISAAKKTDAAYCDGVFLGQLDGRQGRIARPAIGRWNSEKDRSLFKAGYEKGYKEARASAMAGQLH